jgi:hypothetical protein
MWRDVPKDQWIACPLVELLPEERQRFYQQINQDGDIRLQYVSTRTIETEVFVIAINRLLAAIDKLERKL